jgi:hypothetical protein
VKVNDIYINNFNKIASLLPKSFALWLDTNESIEPWKTFENNYEKLDHFFKITRILLKLIIPLHG